MKTCPDPHGYLMVSLSWNGKVRRCRVHNLVAQAFLGPCPPGLEVNHKDGVKAHLNVGNLEYATHQYNMAHAYCTGLMKAGENLPQAKLTADEVRQIRRLYVPGVMGCIRLARQFGVTSAAIQHIVQHKSWVRVEG